MDSLLASYASSDEEDDHQQQPPPPKQIQPTQSQPNFFTSLPPPKSQSTSLFSKLPQPKSQRSDPFSLNPPKPKKVVQFRPPLPTSNILDDDDDDEEDGVQELKKKDVLIPETPSVKSFLTSIPAPRNSGSLGGFSSAAGTGRRSVLDADVPGLSNSNVVKVAVDNNSVGNGNDNVNVNESSFDVAAPSADYGSYEYSGYGEYQNVGTDYGSYGPAAPGPAVDDHAGYGGYEGYSGYGNYGEYESKWIDRSSVDLGNEIPVAEVVQSVARVPGKRGRSEIPQDIIEVSQDELMKNRPREDKTKLTGIAFGPSYQPASSTKGKPTKLHKRKHQIGSLYFDMRSKESELAERRSKGLLTKAETHAKYGW